MFTAKTSVKKSFLTSLLEFMKFFVSLIVSSLLSRFVTMAIVGGVSLMFSDPLVGLVVGLISAIVIIWKTDLISQLDAVALKGVNGLFDRALVWSNHRDKIKQAKLDAEEAAVKNSGVRKTANGKVVLRIVPL